MKKSNFFDFSRIGLAGCSFFQKKEDTTTQAQTTTTQSTTTTKQTTTSTTEFQRLSLQQLLKRNMQRRPFQNSLY